MSKFKEKAPTFIFGLLFGITIAGGFFIFKLDDYIKELNFYKHFGETFSSFNNNDDDEKRNTTNEKKQLKSTQKVTENNKTVDKKLLTENKISQANIFSENLIPTDSVIPVKNLEVNPEEIVIKKDELIISKTLHLIELKAELKTTNKDSALSKVSGLDIDNPVKMMNVEFWQSPLNFKGYKMSKYKIVLFGLKWIEGIKIYKAEDSVFLKTGNLVYQLDYSNEFKGYNPITEDAVLSQLK